VAMRTDVPGSVREKAAIVSKFFWSVPCIRF
jgi:hypothetical protein